ncbi:hypothetical protein APUTEX25_005336, partial [Auxenochlorella protothecoides]
ARCSVLSLMLIGARHLISNGSPHLQESFKALGDHVNQTKLELMRSQMAVFKESLEQFALKYRSDIRRDPAFRESFHAMCVTIGVDPLASNKGIWNRLLGFGDFYYELGVQCVETCLVLRSSVGALVELNLLLRHIQARDRSGARCHSCQRRGSAAEAVSADDVLKSLEKLSVLGGGLGVVTVGGSRYVRSQPMELSRDAADALDFAQRSGGFFSAPDLSASLGWAPARTEFTLQQLLRDGLTWLDLPPDAGAPCLYWVPAVGMEQAAAAYAAAHRLA